MMSLISWEIVEGSTKKCTRAQPKEADVLFSYSQLQLTQLFEHKNCHGACCHFNKYH